MSLLYPSYAFKLLTNVNFELLKELEIDLILLDVDNTLSEHDSQIPFEGVIEWTNMIKSKGISIIIVSNNFKSRVEPFAQKFDLPFVSLALKPLPIGFSKAKRLFNKKAENILVIGDQIFTDILGANLAGMKSILLEPIVIEKQLNIRFKRILEKPIRKKIKMNS